MPSCVFRKCTNYDSKVDKSHGISYHMFPTNEDRLLEWIAIVRLQRSESDWTPSKGSRICSNHFKATDKYISNTGRTLLEKNSIPIIPERKNQNVQNSTTSDNKNSLMSLDNSSILDNEDSIETPIKAALKNSVRELTLKKNLLIKRNKILNQQSKRLMKRVATVTYILKDLKKQVAILKILKNKLQICTNTVQV